MRKILVVGSINMDLMVESPVIPGPGETVMGTTYRYVPGGKGANQAVAALRSGAETSFCAMVGKDGNGRELKEGLAAQGMDLSFFGETEAAPTGLAVIPVDAQGQNRIIVLAGANHELTPEVVTRAVEAGWDAVLIQFEIPKETVIAACNAAAAKGIPTVVDAGPVCDFPLEKIAGITVISPNESEAENLVGFPVVDEASAKEACVRLMERSAARYVVLKLGSHGAMLYDGESTEIYPALKGLKVVDTTAAGDSFTAALTDEWLRTGDMKAAVRYANAAGGLATTVKGAQPSAPKRSAIEKKLEEC